MSYLIKLVDIPPSQTEPHIAYGEWGYNFTIRFSLGSAVPSESDQVRDIVAEMIWIEETLDEILASNRELFTANVWVFETDRQNKHSCDGENVDKLWEYLVSLKRNKMMWHFEDLVTLWILAV